MFEFLCTNGRFNFLLRTTVRVGAHRTVSLNTVLLDFVADALGFAPLPRRGLDVFDQVVELLLLGLPEELLALYHVGVLVDEAVVSR